LAIALAAVVGGAMVGCSGGAGETATDNGAPATNGEANPSAGARPMPTAEGNTAGETIKIGVVASLSGEQKPWGDDSYNGAKIAVEEINAEGGINGKKVELLVGDSTSKPEPAKSAAEKLISDGVIGIVGEVASGHTIQIAKSAFMKGIPVVAVGATKTTLTDEGAHVFRVCYTDDFQGPVMAVFAYNELGLRKVAVMTDNKQPYSQGLSQSFSDKFKQLGGEIVTEIKYETGQTQFAGQVTELKAKSPAGIFLSGYFPEVGPISQAVKQAGMSVKLMGGDGWDSPKLLDSGGDAIIGGFFCNHYNNKEPRPEVAEFLKKWKAKFGGEPGTTMAALGYDATRLMLDACKRAEKLDSKSLLKAIDETVDFAGVAGKISLKGFNGNPPKRALVVEVRPLSEGFQIFRKAYEVDEVK
jgi:branched-chain amino acid transport system substrate-binding protein